MDKASKHRGLFIPPETMSTGERNIDADGLRRAFERALSSPDAVMLERALGILHRMATERTGWERFISRWYYSDEPLRNDAANLVREARFGMMRLPVNTRLVGDKE